MEEIYSKGLFTYNKNTFSGIYGWLCHLTNKWYVGESKDVLKRTASYVKNPACLKNQILIKNAITKYGIKNFTCYKLEECSFNDLLDKEVYWGNKLNALARNGYNLRLGGCKKIQTSQLTREKISKANSNKVRTAEHKKNISEGTKKRMTPEVCAIISAKAKGRVQSQIQREKHRKSMLGKNTGPRSEEVKHKISVGVKLNHLMKWLEKEAPWFCNVEKI